MNTLNFRKLQSGIKNLNWSNLQKVNPIELLWNTIKNDFDNFDFNSLAKQGFPKLAYVISILNNPNDNLWDIATSVAEGKNEQTMKIALKNNEAKFYSQVGVKAGGTILEAVGVISMSNPITAVIFTAINLFVNLANFGSITARQRSEDAERHLDNYRKLIPNLAISDKAKSVLHEQIQKLRQIRPKCKSLRKPCEVEHTRYWFIGQMFREIIDYYVKMKQEMFTEYNENLFIELCNYEGFNLEKYVNDFKKSISNITKETTEKETTEKKEKKSLLDILFNFIDEIFSLFIKKV